MFYDAEDERQSNPFLAEHLGRGDILLVFVMLEAEESSRYQRD